MKRSVNGSPTCIPIKNDDDDHEHSSGSSSSSENKNDGSPDQIIEIHKLPQELINSAKVESDIQSEAESEVRPVQTNPLFEPK